MEMVLLETMTIVGIITMLFGVVALSIMATAITIIYSKIRGE